MNTSRYTRNAILIFAMIIALLLSVVLVCGGACPSTKTAWCGTDDQGHWVVSTATWTHPSGCSGAKKIPVTVNMTGVTYAVWIWDNTDNEYELSEQTFSSTLDCNNGFIVSSLTAGHSYTMTVDMAVGQGIGTSVVFAEAKIFVSCNQQ